MKHAKTINKGDIDEKKETKIRDSTTYMLDGLDIDALIEKIRTVVPCNRTTLRNLAVLELFRTSSLKAISVRLIERRAKNKAIGEELSDDIVFVDKEQKTLVI